MIKLKNILENTNEYNAKLKKIYDKFEQLYDNNTTQKDSIQKNIKENIYTYVTNHYAFPNANSNADFNKSNKELFKTLRTYKTDIIEDSIENYLRFNGDYNDLISTANNIKQQISQLVVDMEEIVG